MQRGLLLSSATTVLAVIVVGLSVCGESRPLERHIVRPPARPLLPSRQPTADEPAAPTATARARGHRPTRIRAAAIELDVPVVEVGWGPSPAEGAEMMEWQVPEDAAGYHRGSACPGEGGNTVISGHNNVGRAVFGRLIDVSPGDAITVYAGEAPHHYRVEQVLLLRQAGASPDERSENARFIEPTADERLTLVTCWPDTGNSHRLIVIARPELRP